MWINIACTISNNSYVYRVFRIVRNLVEVFTNNCWYIYVSQLCWDGVYLKKKAVAFETCLKWKYQDNEKSFKNCISVTCQVPHCEEILCCKWLFCSSRRFSARYSSFLQDSDTFYGGSPSSNVFLYFILQRSIIVHVCFGYRTSQKYFVMIVLFVGALDIGCCFEGTAALTMVVLRCFHLHSKFPELWVNLI
jgi:hypothetical protein